MTTLTGEVQRVTYENEETGFRVVQVSSGPGSEPVPVVGVFQAVGPGNQVRASGSFVQDARHGRQFRAESLLVLAPETLEGIERYLGSGVIPGLGPGFARRIVRCFGEQTLQVLDDDPAQLRRVPGLKGKRLRQIREGWAEQRRSSNVRLLLQTHGASLSLANRIIQKYEERAAEMVERHPYRLAIEVRGIGFRTADRLASSLGIERDHPERVQAGTLHVLREFSDSGDVRCPRANVEAKTAQLLGVDTDHVRAGIEALWAAGRLVVEEEDVYLARLHQAEQIVAECFRRLLQSHAEELSGCYAAVEAFEARAGYALSEQQRESVQRVAREKVLVVTGGPGVGKTTVVRAIVSVLQSASLSVSLAAPTGRAAKRLSESTGQHAVTLHRLLEYEPRLGSFRRDSACPLDTQAIVVDEASMVDVQLAASLLSAIPDGGRLVLVGDVDQLPSVGPGAVLHDVIACQRVPTVRLDRIFRQSEASSIVHAAHAILAGREPTSDVAGSDHAEFFVISKRNAEQAAAVVRELVTQRIPRRFGLSPERDVQVLTPMHRGPVGTHALNALLQEALNPPLAGSQGDSPLRPGDKVMQVRNDYDKEVFNGDLGLVTARSADGVELEVAFEGRSVRYVGRESDALSLAYATSIHKSQGSEYPVVVMPLQTSHYPMLSRNLIYTGVTRAKQLCVLVADPRAISMALGELRREQRSTGLRARIQRALEKASDRPATELARP